ncbi:MAG TPA: nuclear transport factor 2 family protein [Solirubrobacterales bacterium]|nr:nuclear transport factor 2 family protein [Solirubrobacterales bacterium]
MGDSPVEVVEAYFEAWNRRDLEALEATLHPDCEWRRSADFPEGRTLRGKEGMVDFARSMFDVFADTPIEIERCVEGRDGCVAVGGASRFVGGRSGAETSASWARVYEVRGERIVSIRPYSSVEDALAAAGAA